ncbi:MAG: hypothetical protein KDE31_30025, partial [Caldilineaceae bacterium]|nr:hypothetical protein [Caldilineaceae bacterium]
MTNETYTTKTEHTETDNNLTQQAKQAADRTKQQAQAAAEHAKASAKAGAHQAAHEASKMANELGAEAKQMAADATHEAEVRVNEQKGYAADRLSGVAHALRATGENFRNEDEGAFANYADSAADQVDRFAGYLRDQNVNDLARDVQQLAKRQPELFVAGALAAGFFLG